MPVALKGGREAAQSNRALTEVAHAVLAKHGIDASAMVLLEDRADVDSLLGMDDLVEMVIARGCVAIHPPRAQPHRAFP